MNKKIIEKVVVAARISDEYDRLLQAFANRFERDKSELIAEAIKNHVNKLLDKYGVPDGYYPPSKDNKES
jgi:predicted DNA-binding protein